MLLVLLLQVDGGSATDHGAEYEGYRQPLHGLLLSSRTCCTYFRQWSLHCSDTFSSANRIGSMNSALAWTATSSARWAYSVPSSTVTMPALLDSQHEPKQPSGGGSLVESAPVHSWRQVDSAWGCLCPCTGTTFGIVEPAFWLLVSSVANHPTTKGTGLREKYIARMARHYGLDPRAVLAVASQEGLSGGVGDGGHAFGPFQMNDAGGVLTNAPAGHHSNAYAWSNAGINQALRGMSTVASGLKGPAAVRAIVSRFERPADPSGEISGALGQLGHVGSYGGSIQQGGGGQGLGSGGSHTAFNPAVYHQMAAQMMLQNAVATANGQQPMDMTQGLLMARQAATQRLAASQGNQGNQQGTASMGVGTGGKIPGFAKIIGMPHQGTHTLGNWESDNAIDIAMPRGTPIRAAQNGVIGSQIGALDSNDPHMEGLRVHLDGKNQSYYYAHLSKLTVHAGQHVRAGQIIGYSGSANGVNHLHIATENGNPTPRIRRFVL